MAKHQPSSVQQSPQPSQAEAPVDLVPIARVVGAWGVHGWVRVKPYAAESAALEAVSTWWLKDSSNRCRAIETAEIKPHSGDWVVRFEKIDDRDAAEAFKGMEVSVPRSGFPATDDEEFYWIDLIGCDAFDPHGEPYGQVVGVMDNGAHAILEVRIGQREDGRPIIELIPFVDAHVREDDITAKRIAVDWSPPA